MNRKMTLLAVAAKWGSFGISGVISCIALGRRTGQGFASQQVEKRQGPKPRATAEQKFAAGPGPLIMRDRTVLSGSRSCMMQNALVIPFSSQIQSILESVNVQEFA